MHGTRTEVCELLLSGLLPLLPAVAADFVHCAGGSVLRGQRQGSALHPRLRGVRQRALPSGLPLGL